MPSSTELGDLERCRGYLRVLARQAMKASLKAKIDESDVAQETLLQAHRQRHQFRGKSHAELLAWLREILKNKLCDMTRKYGAAKRDVDRERSIFSVVDASSARLERTLAAACVSPSSEAMQKELATRVSAALEALPPRQREAVELHYLLDYSFSQVGARMELSRDQVAGLIRRGVAKLRRMQASLDNHTSGRV